MLDLKSVTLAKVTNIFMIENMQKIILVDENDTLTILELEYNDDKLKS